MKIAVLGWGSLIWDKRPEFDDWHKDWQPDGPKLDLEFSRVSKSRLGALTLVIDAKNGEPCTASYALSKRQNPKDAICDLRCREDTTVRNIGYYFADGSDEGEPTIPDSIPVWAKKKGFDVVVWTGLTSNFEKKVKKAFSVPKALCYLQRLRPEEKTKAAEYVLRAPEFIQTPLRKALEVEPWFTSNNK